METLQEIDPVLREHGYPTDPTCHVQTVWHQGRFPDPIVLSPPRQRKRQLTPKQQEAAANPHKSTDDEDEIEPWVLSLKNMNVCHY